MASRGSGVVVCGALALVLALCSSPTAGPTPPTAPASVDDLDDTTSAPVDPRIGLRTRQELSGNQIVRVDFIGELVAADLAAWQIMEAPAPTEYGGPASDIRVGPGRMTLSSGVTIEVAAETPGSRGCQLLDPQQVGNAMDPAAAWYQRCLVSGAFLPGTTTAAWFSAREAEYGDGRLRTMWITGMQDDTVIGALPGSSRYLLQLPRSDDVLIGCQDGSGPTIDIDGVPLPPAAAYVATVDAATVEPEAVGIECLYGQ